MTPRAYLCVRCPRPTTKGEVTPTDIHQPTELESLRYLFQMLQGHFPGCNAIRSFDFGEEDCTCHRAERCAAIQAFIPPRAPITPDADAADSARREDRADRLEAIWAGHIPVEGDAALLLAEYKRMGAEYRAQQQTITRYRLTLQQRNHEIARLRRELYGPR